MEMKTLIESKSKLRVVSFNNSACKLQDKLITSKTDLDLKFYQKLFVIFFATCTLLIFPESPKNSEVLCNKYHPQEICNVW